MKPLPDEVRWRASAMLFSPLTIACARSLQDSADENFEAPLDPSSSDVSSSSDSEEEESEPESEANDVEPMPKRFKTGRDSASSRTTRSSKISAKSSAKNVRRSASKRSPRLTGRKRARSQSSSEEDSDASDSGAEISDEEVAPVSNTQNGNNSTMQDMASGSGSASASSSNNEAQPENSTHPGEQACLSAV